MTAVVGLDLSLTSTGIAVLSTTNGITTRTVKSKGKRGASVAETADRLCYLADEIARVLDSTWIDLAVIESPSFGSAHGAAHERGGLWWMVAGFLRTVGTPIATVSPQGRAKYATGSGKASKDEVLAAVIRRYPQVNVTDNNVADALVLAAMGWRHLGDPIEPELPAACLAAMDGAKWPTLP